MSALQAFHVHGTCVSINGKGVLIRGAPGSGKSELALRLIDAPGFGAGDELLRAMLVADDQTRLTYVDGKLWASAPEQLAGLLELRGQGLLRFDHMPRVVLALIVDLMVDAPIARLPEAKDLQTTLGGVTLPRIPLDGRQPAAPAVVRAVLSGALTMVP